MKDREVPLLAYKRDTKDSRALATAQNIQSELLCLERIRCWFDILDEAGLRGGCRSFVQKIICLKGLYLPDKPV
ncbi:MAG: hypothetical protein NC341_13605 [Blautia sp.]|nr:hypothetical protein [Blautia sp.]MCM1200106.1 hypothetical protein [Bacteroides fragilis]